MDAMQADAIVPPLPLQDLPTTPRLKRVRGHNRDLDVELDSYFRTKRFMTEAVTKEMEDVAISEEPLTTSPSRTSTLARLAEKGPSRSNIAGVLDFDAPRLSVSASSGRRRHLVVTSANSPQLNRSGSFSDISMTGSSMMAVNDDFDEDEEEERGNDPWLDWRSPISPKPHLPRPMPLEDALQRLIEKKKESEAKALILHRTPSEIIKGAAQSAIYARLRASPPFTGALRSSTSRMGSPTSQTYSQAPFTNFTQRGSWGSSMSHPSHDSSSSSSPSPMDSAQMAGDFGQRPNNTFPRAPTPPFLNGSLPAKRRSLVIEEVPDDDDLMMASSPTLKSNSFLGNRRTPSQVRQMHVTPQQHTKNHDSMLSSSEELYQDGLEGENETQPSRAIPMPDTSIPPYRSSYSDYMLTDDSMSFQHVPQGNNPLQMPSSGFGARSFASEGRFTSSLNRGPLDQPKGTRPIPFGSTENRNNGFRTSPPPRFSLFNGDPIIDTDSGMDLCSTPPATPPMGHYQ